MEGRINSVQSLGAVDGPGLRYIVFLQGCPLRCKYCHNPETWDTHGGELRTAEALCKTILRYRPYFGETGGVTVSGGEPLLQPEFTAELFRLLHENGVHTALDTAGAGDLAKAEAVLRHTDLVLCDLKFPTEADYRAHCGSSSLRAVRDLCAEFSNLEKIEWLPFKNICAAKYESLGIEFPMADKPAFSQKHIDMLLAAL